MATQTVLNNLSPEEAARLRQLEELFGTTGWKIVVEWARTQQVLSLERAARASSWDDNRIEIGKERVFSDLVNLQQSTEAEFETMAESNAQSQDAEDIIDTNSQS